MANSLELKMNSAPFSIFINLILTLLIFYNAEIGRILGIHNAPLALSVVWPASGFSLAALLLFGYKVWPAIFLGNFSYNFFHLYDESSVLHVPILVSSIVALASLTEGLIAAYIMKKYSSSSYGYFNNMKDVLVFLIPAALFPSLLAAIVGVSALSYYAQSFSFSHFSYLLMTFWVGDTMGIYIITPLLLVWILKEPFVKLRQFSFEAILMLVTFFLITGLTFGIGLPLGHFYIPLCLWVTYRFRFHGATFIILIVSLVSIIPTSLQKGPYVASFELYSLLILVTFLQMIIITCLITAALISEREQAWKQLKDYNYNLEKEVYTHQEQLKAKIIENFIKEKLVSIGLLTSGIAKQIQIPLKKIDRSIHTSIDFLKQLEKSLDLSKEKMHEDVLKNLNKHLQTLEYHLSNATKYETQAFKIAKVIQEQSIIGTPGRLKIRLININNLVSNCLIRASAEEKRRDPDFVFSVLEKFDKGAEMILALPEDLANAITFLMQTSLQSLKNMQGKHKLTLEVKTKNFHDRVEIAIRDNGAGITQEQMNYFSQAILQNGVEEVSDFGFALVHDIIAHIYHGEIKVDMVKGIYEEFTLILPKDAPETLPKEGYG